jgi:flagellar hook assembly protein FlgD
MARKKTQQSKGKVPLELLIDRDEAKVKLEGRIEKGQELRKLDISDQHSLGEIVNQYIKWDDFNNELLKRLFTSEELYEEYIRWIGTTIMLTHEKNLQDKISDFYEEIDEKNHRLDSIIERLELIPESSLVK